RSDAESASRTLEFRQASYNRPNGCAVHVRNASHVKDYAGLVSRDHSIHFSLQPCAFRTAVDVPSYPQRNHPWPDSSFREFKVHDAVRSSPSYGNCRISRTQSPSAENIDPPHPHGTSGAVFWFTALSASA